MLSAAKLPLIEECWWTAMVDFSRCRAATMPALIACQIRLKADISSERENSSMRRFALISVSVQKIAEAQNYCFKFTTQ